MHAGIVMMTGLSFWLGTVALPAQDAGAEQGKESEANIGQSPEERPLPPTLEDLRRAVDIEILAMEMMGEERKALLEEAAQAYREIAIRHASDRPGSARAWFGAGEAWRRRGDLDSAEESYKKSASIGSLSVRERSLFEVAQLQRRSKRYEAAIKTYGEVVRMKSGTSRQHEARLWSGRCLEAQGKQREAVMVYRTAVDVAGRPLWMIAAGNRLANLLVKAGDLEGALEAIEGVERSLSEGISSSVSRLRRAFEKMSARRALQRAFDRKNAAHRDAQRWERDAVRRDGAETDCRKNVYLMPIP